MNVQISQFSGGKIHAERLAKMAEDPYWDEELAKGRYSLPLSVAIPDESRETRQELHVLAIDIPPDQLYNIGTFLCAKSPQSHKGPYRHAIDFLVLDGVPVLAAADGVVVESVYQFTEWDDNPELASRMNLVTIKHEGKNGIEFSQYCHLAKGSVKVRVGNKVKKGEQIARVGKVGWTDRDHLHFIVFRNDQGGPVGFKSLKVRKFVRHKRFWLF